MVDDTQDVVAMLREYHTRGWALVRLHHIVDGHCTCRRGAQCGKSAGKHPNVGAGWETRPAPSWPDVQAWLDEDPDANWGVRTGAVSGIFVLDWDPANATGPVDLSVLPPPHTRTGGGGYHWFFQMPTDFEPNNSSGRLPVGFDIRGTSGQVVVPPSVSGKGGYVMLPGMMMGAYAPTEQLLSLIRPAPKAAPAPAAPAVPNLSYVAAAVGGMLRELAELPEGRRNHEGWRLARRIREVCAGGGVDAEVYRDHYLDALARTGLEFEEAVDLWDVKSTTKAVEPVGPVQRAAFLPGALPPQAVPPFPASATEPPPESGGLRSKLLRRSELGRLPRPAPLIEGVLNLDSDSWLIGASGSGKSFVAIDWACHVATGKPWNDRPVRQGVVLYVAAEGAAGIAQRIEAWESRHGPVGDELMILPLPVQAVRVAGGGVAMTPEWRELIELAAEDRPVLVVLDTQARLSVGLNENDNGQMGQWIAAVSALREACGACVLVVHHTGRGGGDARGASAIDAAQDMEWKIERIGPKGEMRARLRCEKSKDGRDDLEWGLALTVVQLPTDAHGARSSLTLVFDQEGPARLPEMEYRAAPTEIQAEVLHVLREVGLPEGETQSVILGKINEFRKAHGRGPMGKSTLTYALTREGTMGGLLEKGLVVRNGQKWADKAKFDRWSGFGGDGGGDGSWLTPSP